MRIAVPLLATLVAFSSFAQAPTAEVTGRVTDPSGGVVANAAVEVLNTGTGVKWKTLTNGEGYYTAPILPPGNYRVTVSAAGFRPSARPVTLVVEQVARVDFSLVVGAVTETVEVTGAGPLLESSTASLGQLIQQEAVADLPLNGRNYLSLAKLSMGVAEPSGIGQAGTAGDRAKNGGSFVANGVRSDMNNFILDGIDNNAKIVNLSSNANVIIEPSVDAIQEFKVETNNFSAEYGYSAGAVVNATIKSGNNGFHGDAFEFLRNDHLDALNYFVQPGSVKPILQRNQYGGTFGGPIRKNKTFFFGSWEGTRQNQGNTLVNTIPTSAMIQGNFAGQKPIFDPASLTTTSGQNVRTQFPNNAIPASRFAPAAAAVSALIPAPNAPGVSNFVVSPLQTTHKDQFDFRGDHNFSDNDRFFARYSFYKYYFDNPGPFPAPLIGTTNFQSSINNQTGNEGALGETHVFGANLVNEFRAGYNRISNSLEPFVNQYLDQQFGFAGFPQQPGVTGLPNISITGYSNLGEAAFLPDAKGSDTFVVSDSISWSKGKHFVKAGFEYRWVRSRFHIDGNARGSPSFSGVFTNNPQSPSATGNGFADFLLGDANNATLSNIFIGDLRYKYYGAFINDDWKVTPKLTFNLGIRYEIWTPPIERNNQQGNFLLGPQKLIYPDNAMPLGIPSSLIEPIPGGIDSRGLLENRYNNWSPRLGVAYQILPHTVIRAGVGIFYGEPDAQGASGRPPAEPPFRINNTYPTDNLHPIVTLQTGFPANALSPTTFSQSAATFIAWNPGMLTAYVAHWSFSLQQQVGQWVVDANYVGTKGTHLSTVYNVDLPLPGPGSVASREPIPGFGSIQFQDSMGNSNYQALQMHGERRFASGLSVVASYTYAKFIDLSEGGLAADLAVRNARDVFWEKALSTADMRHRFVVSYLYELPFGTGKRFKIGNAVANGVLGNWQVNGITTIHSGQPFTPELNFSSANTGDNRPNGLRNGNLPSGQRTPTHWFDVTAFAAAPNYLFGNAGRDIVTGPGAVNFDFSLFKRFPVRKLLGELGEVQFRGEFFNLFNHPQFGQPNATVNIPQGGTITFLSNSMRQIQFGVKILF